MRREHGSFREYPWSASVPVAGTGSKLTHELVKKKETGCEILKCGVNGGLLTPLVGCNRKQEVSMRSNPSTLR